MLRRARYQIAPIATMLTCTVLAVWLWARHARSSVAVGEVSAIRIPIESKVDALLAELPQPVAVFDRVSKGQVIARLDMTLVETQLARMLAEMEQLQTPTAGERPAGPLAAEREAQIAELRAKLEARDLKSPINGTVMEVLRRPGQSTPLGQPIMTIAAEEADCIIGYMREDQPLRPVPGMAVTVRKRSGTTPRRAFESYVMAVAPQVMPMPSRHLYKVDVPEWALRVQVAIPPEANLTPGEIVDLSFYPKRD
jgi:multidrug resistance efflux pump